MTRPEEMQIFSDKSPEHTQIEIEGQSSYDRDRGELARLGKKQVLKVRNQQPCPREASS